MIAEIGHALLWLATGCAALAAVAGLMPRLTALAVPAALATAWLWLWVGGALAWVFANADLSVAAVAANTQATLPVALRLAAAVLRDGGGLPLAVAAAALLAATLAFRGAPPRLIGGASLVTLALQILVLAAAPPFARLAPAPTDGAGFAAAWRDRLAALAPPGGVVFDTLLATGARDSTGATGVRLAALTPVVGPDSTAVLAEIHVTVGGTDVGTLIPAWRETILPPHGAPVADDALSWQGWWSATLGPPRDDGRWRVRVTRLPLGWIVAPGLAAVALTGWAVRRAMRRGR